MLNLYEGMTAQDFAEAIMREVNVLSPIGSISPYAGLIQQENLLENEVGQGAPTGWAICAGQSFDKNCFPELFEIIGYQYGGADDLFNLPDLRGRKIAGYNNDHAFGSTAGSDTVTLTSDNIAPHDHNIKDLGHSHNYGTSGYQSSGSTSQAGDHNHNVSTAGAGNHNHGMDDGAGEGNSYNNVHYGADYTGIVVGSCYKDPSKPYWTLQQNNRALEHGHGYRMWGAEPDAPGDNIISATGGGPSAITMGYCAGGMGPSVGKSPWSGVAQNWTMNHVHFLTRVPEHVHTVYQNTTGAHSHGVGTNTTGIQVQSVGNSQPVNTLDPTLYMNYIIRTGQNLCGV